MSSHLQLYIGPFVLADDIPKDVLNRLQADDKFVDQLAVIQTTAGEYALIPNRGRFGNYYDAGSRDNANGSIKLESRAMNLEVNRFSIYFSQVLSKVRLETGLDLTPGFGVVPYLS